jgi:hypothetical protein
MGRSGTATLPLHYGRVPPWLATRMASLGRVIVEAIALEYGRDEVLRRLAHPFWFQCFGAVMGMDWHSSGITTSVIGALKRGLGPISHEVGIYVCGGRGNESRKTPAELGAIAERTGLDGAALARASRLVAKVDSAAVQDGYGLYLHGFFVTPEGRWAVVQQGMNEARRDARRYHWLSEGLTSFANEPHAAIEGPRQEALLLNVVDGRAAPSREAQLALLRELAPDRIVRELAKAEGHDSPHLVLPGHHDVRAEDVVSKRLGGTLAAAAERGPRDYEDLLLTPGVGPRTVFALATVAEVLHGAPSRFSDPARFSLAHGGKDGHPFPVPLRVYDETLRVMRDAVARAKLGNDDRLGAMRKLDAEARRLEAQVESVDFEGFLAHERATSHEHGGMTVFGPARPPRERRAKAAAAPGGQLTLPGLRRR